MSSRVAHHLDFAAYQNDELLAIGHLMLDKSSYYLSAEAMAAFRDCLSPQMTQPQFANARSVRAMLLCMSAALILPTLAAGAFRLRPFSLADIEASLTVVMSDLGRAPSLADALLGTGRDRAAQALLDWADACGRLVVAVAGREPEFTRLRRQYAGGEPDDSSGAGLRERVLGVAERAALAGVAAPDGLAAELAAVARPDCLVFSPGDICPDNNLLTPAGVRFIDFEESGHHPAFLDAAYLRMPFSTCWCVFRLPPPAETAGANRAAP
ncbi:MAG: hypothetical protein JWM19_1132 [Actinomycetia bacterium]|nr:hypothetical protein [Actinomycetes bacterium]